MPDLATGEEFEEFARLTSFTDVRLEDMTANVWSSARRLYRRALAGYPATALLRVLHLRGDEHLSGARSGLEQHRALQRGLWLYGIFTAATDTSLGSVVK